MEICRTPGRSKRMLWGGQHSRFQRGKKLELRGRKKPITIRGGLSGTGYSIRFSSPVLMYFPLYYRTSAI